MLLLWENLPVFFLVFLSPPNHCGKNRFLKPENFHIEMNLKFNLGPLLFLDNFVKEIPILFEKRTSQDQEACYQWLERECCYGNHWKKNWKKSCFLTLFWQDSVHHRSYLWRWPCHSAYPLHGKRIVHCMDCYGLKDISIYTRVFDRKCKLAILYLAQKFIHFPWSLNNWHCHFLDKGPPGSRIIN